MQGLFGYIFGYRRFLVKREDSSRLLELLIKSRITSSGARFCGDGLIFSVSFAASARLVRECQRRGIALTLVSSHGLPHFFYRYRHRAGIYVGILLSAIIIAYSSSVIFAVRVDGNRRLSDKEVISELCAAGLHLGDARRKVDTDAIENRVMINSDDVSWISINIIGTVAEVQIRETDAEYPPEPLYDAANVVAAKDGFIERFEDTRGNVIAEVGELVREGELLISGLYDSSAEGLRYTCAKGRVMARTKETVRVEIPLEYEKKVYTGAKRTEKYLIFFEKTLKFFGKCGNLPTTCDTIDKVEYLNLFSLGELPFGIRTVRYSEYRYEKAERSIDEAVQLAYKSLEEELAKRAETVELAAKRIYIEEDERQAVLICEIEAVEDIAEIREIVIS